MSNDREAGTRPVPEYARELAAQMDDARAQARRSDGVIRAELGWDLDVDAAAGEGLDALAMADHHSDPFHKYVARYAAERRLTAAAMDMAITHGPMSEGRAELVHARAALTLAGQHAAADALRRELVGVV